MFIFVECNLVRRESCETEAGMMRRAWENIQKDVVIVTKLENKSDVESGEL